MGYAKMPNSAHSLGQTHMAWIIVRVTRRAFDALSDTTWDTSLLYFNSKHRYSYESTYSNSEFSTFSDIATFYCLLHSTVVLISPTFTSNSQLRQYACNLLKHSCRPSLVVDINIRSSAHGRLLWFIIIKITSFKDIMLVILE